MTVATSEHLSIITESARDFAEKFIRPDMMEWDETQHFQKTLMGLYDNSHAQIGTPDINGDIGGQSQ